MSMITYVKKHFELIISFVAVTMAIAAVVVAFYETSLMREEAHMSVKPSIWMETNLRTHSSDGAAEGEFEFLINNRGLGPASLEYFTVQYKGEYVASWGKWISKVAPNENGEDRGILGVSYSSAPQKYILPNGESLQAFSIRAPSELVRKIDSGDKDSVFSICACSFYEECWITKNIDLPPRPVDQCDIDPKYQFRSSLN